MSADADVRDASQPVPPGLASVRLAWREARRSGEPRGEPLAAALRAYARRARAEGASVASLLLALDALARRDDGEPDFARVREWAGAEVIRAYFRAD
jgi:hypothetical protein